MISPIFHHDKTKKINEDIKILNEIQSIKSKEKIKKIKRNLESFIENLNSFTMMLSIIFEKIEIKIRNNKVKREYYFFFKIYSHQILMIYLN